LAPVWEEVAEELEGISNLVIAKMDSTANEVDDLRVQSYPTLKFYPSNKKKKPVEFDGDRTKEGIIKWLKKHTTKVVDWTGDDEYKEDL